jgi:formylglycine-generating enzyme required for sulfatase activity
MTNGSPRNLKFYCPAHQIRFDAAGERVVSCEQGGHPIGSGFPKGSWWEFCCDCGTFWPADPTNSNLHRTECRVCERSTAKRYLCTACQVVSLESTALVRRKTYSIDSESGIKPACPGCDTKSNVQLREHDCAEISVRLLTSRSSCPFCENSLGPQAPAKVEQPAPAAFRHCPFCGIQQKAGHRFCKSCGKAQPEIDQLTKANDESARRKADETAARQKTTEARRRATAEALRLAEEERRRERAAKRKAEEDRIAEKIRQTAAREAAAIEAEKKAHQEEKRKAQLAEEARRQEEERQRSARESQRRADEEAARQHAEEEARLTAERLRKAEEARALAEQEQLRLKEVQRQQADHERLVSELHQRAKEEEARRAREAEATQPDQNSLTTPEVEPKTQLEDQTKRIAAPEENHAHNDEAQSAADSGELAGEADPEVAAHEVQQNCEPGSTDRSSTNEFKSSHEGNSSSASDSKGLNEGVTAREYLPSWDQPSPFTASQPRRVPRVWLVGLLVVVVIGVLLTVIATKQRVNTDDNARTRPVPTPTGPIVPIGMVRIPGGEFTLGSDRSDADQQEKPAHKVTLAPFYIDATEVTCEDYQRFVKATGHKAPAKWLDGSCATGDTRKPVTGVDWYDANDYAKWANKRLPTEEEWEFAARGTTGWIYPWGDEWRTGAANADKAAPGVVVVGTFKGTSPFQCFDMVGNAWEWTASKLVPYPGGKLGQEASEDLRVIRGGSWESDRGSATTTYRFGWPASGGKDYSNTSFRCARDAKQAETAPVVSSNRK